MEKKECIVLTFSATIDAISAEKYCKENSINGKIIPVPRIISASCGMAIKLDPAEEGHISEAINGGKIKTAGKYRIIL